MVFLVCLITENETFDGARNGEIRCGSFVQAVKGCLDGAVLRIICVDGT